MEISSLKKGPIKYYIRRVCMYNTWKFARFYIMCGISDCLKSLEVYYSFVRSVVDLHVLFGIGMYVFEMNFYKHKV